MTVLSKPLNLWDKTGTNLIDGELIQTFSHEFAVNQGEDGDFHWWVETPDKRIIDNSPLPKEDPLDQIITSAMGIDHDRPIYFEWTEPELVSKMYQLKKKHMKEFRQCNGISKEQSLDIMDKIWRNNEFLPLRCSLNASATHRNIPGSRLCVGTFGHRCKGKNKGTICVKYGM